MSFLNALAEIFSPWLENERERRQREYREERAASIARGEAPPRFRSYEEYLASEWWKRLSTHVLDYLSHECEFCGGRATQVHHVRYPRELGTESIKSLYGVCSRCHSIAHGQSAGNRLSECAFCGRRATSTLAIAIQNHEHETQRVCRRCDSLANGYRGQANSWEKDHYEQWVGRWRETMPMLHGGASDAVIQDCSKEIAEVRQRLARPVHSDRAPVDPPPRAAPPPPPRSDLRKFREPVLNALRRGELSIRQLEGVLANETEYGFGEAEVEELQAALAAKTNVLGQSKTWAICQRCGGDGGAGQRCYECGGSGWA